jgi:hypothetical protein
LRFGEPKLGLPRTSENIQHPSLKLQTSNSKYRTQRTIHGLRFEAYLKRAEAVLGAPIQVRGVQCAVVINSLVKPFLQRSNFFYNEHSNLFWAAAAGLLGLLIIN